MTRQQGEDARIESGVHLEGRNDSPSLVADIRWEPTADGLYLLDVRVERDGRVLEGELRLLAEESALLARCEKESLLAAVVTFRPLADGRSPAP